MKPGDLVTELNGESLQGLQHVDVVRLLLSTPNTITINATDIQNTSIRTGAKRRTPGSRIVTRKLRSRSRNNYSPDDSGRSRKVSLYKKIRGTTSLRRSSSLKRAKKTAALLVASPTEDVNNPTPATSTSPGSTHPNNPRPGNSLACCLKLCCRG